MTTDKENLEKIIHFMKHDLNIEVASSISFIDYIINDINCNDLSSAKQNILVLLETFKKLDTCIKNIIEKSF